MAGETRAARLLVEIVGKGHDELIAKQKKLEASVNSLGGSMKTSGSHAKGFSGKLMDTGKASAGLSMRMKDLITGGMLMSIGWQAINGVLTTTVTMFNQLVFASVEVEASMKAIETVAVATGRSYIDVMGLMEKHTDAFMTRTSLAPGILRLLSTSLSTTQLDKFIMAVKDGSTAMGYQASEQLPLIARGFKQLTANILDNIGVTVYLTKLRRRASQELGITQDALSEAQIHQALYNEMIEQTAKYTGLYTEQMETAKGSIARVGTEWTKLTETVSKTEGIKAGADAIANFIQYLREATEMQAAYVYFTEKQFGEFPEILQKAFPEEAPANILKRASAIQQIVKVIAEYDQLTRSTALTEVQRSQVLFEAQKLTVDLANETGIATDVLYRLVDAEREYIYLENMAEDAVKGYTDMLENKSHQLTLDQQAMSMEGKTVGNTMKLLDKEIEVIERSIKAYGELTEEKVEAYLAARNLTEAYIEEHEIEEDEAETIREQVNMMKRLEEEYGNLEGEIDITNMSLREFESYLTYVDYQGRKFVTTLTEGVGGLETFNDRLKEGSVSIEEIELRIRDKTRALQFDRRALRANKDELTLWTDAQREAKQVVGEMTRDLTYYQQLEKKRRILYPEEYEETEEKLRDVSRELTSAIKDRERAQENLLKRMEPKLYKIAQEEAAAAEKKVIELTKEETKTKAKLLDEVSNLEKQIKDYKIEIDGEFYSIKEVNTKVGELEESQKDLNSKIRDGSDVIQDWSSYLRNNRDELKNVKKDLDLLGGPGEILEQTASKINDIFTNWMKVVDAPDKIDKTVTITTIERNIRYMEEHDIGTTRFPYGYQAGTKFVPETGLYQLHRGESVLTQQETQQMTTNNTTNNTPIYVTINAQNRTIEDIFMELNRYTNIQLQRRTS